jgi:hypothetical protein
MIAPFLWDDNPARKLFDIHLAMFWEYPLVMHKSYRYKSFGPKERAYIRSELAKLPNSPLKELLLSILKVVQAPAGSFKIKNFKLKDHNDKLIHTHEIMADPHVFFRVAGLSWLNASSVEIFTNVNNHSIHMVYKEKHIARFLYQYWNTGTQQGYPAKSRTTLKQHVGEHEDLIKNFKPLIEGAWSHLNPLDLANFYDIPLKHEQIRALNGQTIQNGRLALFKDSKSIQTSEAKHVSTKFLESTLKIQPELIDHEDREGNGSDTGNLLSFGMIGEDHE